MAAAGTGKVIYGRVSFEFDIARDWTVNEYGFVPGHRYRY